LAEPSRRELGRNDPCHCGSGKKYKQCHLGKDEEAERAKRAKEVAAGDRCRSRSPEGVGGTGEAKNAAALEGASRTRVGSAS
jgi:hypothetical protein